MTFRTRLVLASTVAVVIAVLLAASAAFLASRNSLLGSLDDSLALRAATALHQGELDYQDSAGFYGELSCLTGESIITNGCRLPVNDRVRQVAAGSGSAYFATVDADGTEYRELVTPVPVGTQINDDNNIPTILPTPAALQLATPMTGVNSQLRISGWPWPPWRWSGWRCRSCSAGRSAARPLGPLNDLTDTVEDAGRDDRRHPASRPAVGSTSWVGCGGPSTACWRRWRRPGRPSASWCSTPPTSCGPRSPACAPTSRWSGGSTSSSRPTARCWWPTSSPRWAS